MGSIFNKNRAERYKYNKKEHVLVPLKGMLISNLKPWMAISVKEVLNLILRQVILKHGKNSTGE